MINWFTLIKVHFLFIFFLITYHASSQISIADTSTVTSSLHNAVNLYHRLLSPETGLYNGSEYAYNTYYRFTINEGHPYFQEKRFDTGAVFYNGILYENVPLMYDIIKEELLTKDPISVNTIRLNTERIQWFVILGHTFIKLNHDSTDNATLPSGFYDLLYNGNTSLYKKISKSFEATSDTYYGIKQYVVESSEYFIKKDNHYYKIKNKKALLLVMNNQKKEVEQFIKKNKLSVKKDKENALKNIVAYYDSIVTPTKKQ
jgi:hypothetical protein